MVVFYHYEWVLKEYTNRPSWIADGGFKTLGAAGVDLFFVISGFIMVYTTTKKAGAADALDFLRKRATRIYPLYWVWTTALLLLWLVGVALKSHHYQPSFLIHSYLLLPFFDGRNYHPFLSQGWTLSFEMLFYIVFSIGILINFKRWKLPFLCASFALLALFSLVLPEHNGLKYLFSEPIIIEFLFGVLAAQVLLRLASDSNEDSMKRLAVALIVIGALGFLSTGFYHAADYLRFVIYGVPALLMVTGAAMLGSSRCPRWLVYLGDASYSIYLTHAFFSMTYAVVLKKYPRLGHFPGDLTIIVAGIVTIAGASLTYPLVERPLMRALSPKKLRASEIDSFGVAKRSPEITEAQTLV
ncbi:Exopolysaccharide production protein ExoZ [Acidisarcina polymorpha]|uniref:Exopolysaccharide production protein ExoZ n=2 Tax=Acidisarcina polymorpha TaxID=2211140 RepID=A0A2Z5FWQ6_9BACT|nr:Exopolysaccharide production protein ExoZ [Acidisarcina polymorpha]